MINVYEGAHDKHVKWKILTKYAVADLWKQHSAVVDGVDPLKLLNQKLSVFDFLAAVG